MNEKPLIVTEHDVKESNLLLRHLRKVSDRLIQLGGRLHDLERATPPPSMGRIREALEATGSHPIRLDNLRGALADSQPAKVTHFNTEPTGLVLQALQNDQLVTVGSTSTGDDIYRVIGGNPNTLRAIKLGTASAPANMMTIDTTQDVSATKTFTSGAGISVSSGGGQFDSAAQYSASVYASTGNAIDGSGPATTISFGTAIYNQGSVYSTGTPTRLSARDAGIYLFGGQATILTTSTGTTLRRISIVLSGANTILDNYFLPGVVMNGTTFYTVDLPAISYALTSADYIEMRVAVGDTSTTDVVGGNGRTTFMFLHKLC